MKRKRASRAIARGPYPALLTPAQRRGLLQGMKRSIDSFERECAKFSYTNTGEAWLLLYQLRGAVLFLLDQDKSGSREL